VADVVAKAVRPPSCKQSRSGRKLPALIVPNVALPKRCTTAQGHHSEAPRAGIGRGRDSQANPRGQGQDGQAAQERPVVGLPNHRRSQKNDRSSGGLKKTALSVLSVEKFTVSRSGPTRPELDGMVRPRRWQRQGRGAAQRRLWASGTDCGRWLRKRDNQLSI